MINSKYTGLVLDVARQRGGASPGTVTLFDHSRFGNDFTWAGCTYVQEPSGLWTPVFDGTSTISTRAFDDSWYLQRLTIEFWLNRTAAATDIMSYVLSGGSAAFAVDSTAGATTLRMRIRDTTPASRYGTPVDVPNGAWYHVVGSWDGTNLNLYLNGGAPQSDNYAGSILIQDAGTMVIGADSAIVNRYLNGRMALIRVYSYALTPAQIRARFAATRRLFGV